MRLPLAAIAEAEEPKASPDKVKHVGLQVEVVDSDIESSARSSSINLFSGKSSIGSSGSASDGLNAGPEIFLPFNEPENETDLRRNFYSLCLSAKFTYATDSLA